MLAEGIAGMTGCNLDETPVERRKSGKIWLHRSAPEAAIFRAAGEERLERATRFPRRGLEE